MSTWLMYCYKATEDDGEELRYSLRSVSTYLHMPDLQVMVVGDCPSWLVGAEHVEGNPTEDKPHNMLWNVAAGAHALTGIGVDRAFYLSDDHLLMYPQESIFPVTWGPLDEHIAYLRHGRKKDDWYRVTIETTQDLLTRAGNLEPYSFEMHQPLPFVPEKAHRCLSSMLSMDPAPFWRTTYGNLVGFDRPVRQTRDGLYFGQSPIPIGLPWVSAVPSAWENMMRSRARKMFREPSRWEGDVANRTGP